MLLKRIFEPIIINNLVLKNRIIMPPIHHLYNTDGFANERFNQYYWRRAEGGIGLVMVGGCRFDDSGGSPGMMSLRTDAFIPGYKEFTKGMHDRGAKVGVQLYHAGRYAHRVANEGREALAPSAVFSRFTNETPKEITYKEMQEIISNWAAAAVRAREAGFDLIELVGSAGYLICQFLSPITNLRTDKYGGSWENRTRFPRELVAAVREAVGIDYPIGMRIAGNDFMEGSNTNEDTILFCKLMEKSGIDLFNVTGGWHETNIPQLSGDVPKAGFSYLAAAVHEAVKIPVAASNRINDPIVAERILAVGEADLVSVGRANIADPDWVKKAESGKLDEIRRCVACNQGCLARTFYARPVECMVNGIAGREYQLKERQKKSGRRILVIGAVPTGCEFAIQAAKHGDSVTIWEKENAIGGQIHMAAVPPAKAEFLNLINYYKAMLAKYNVELILNKEAVPETVVQADYDAVVTATGIIPAQLAITENCAIPIYSAYDILKGKVIAGKNVVVIGGGAVGCEAAQYMAREASVSPDQVYFMLEHKSESIEKILSMINQSKRNISIVDVVKIGSGFEPGTGWPVFKDLARLGVKQYSYANIKDIDYNTVKMAVKDKKSGTVSNVEIPCDMIVTAVGAKSNNMLYERLKSSGINVYNLGDSKKVGKILDAVRDAYELAELLNSPD